MSFSQNNILPWHNKNSLSFEDADTESDLSDLSSDMDVIVDAPSVKPVDNEFGNNTGYSPQDIEAYNKLSTAEQLLLHIEYREAWMKQLKKEVDALHVHLEEARKTCPHDWDATREKGSHGMEVWYTCRLCKALRQ